MQRVLLKLTDAFTTETVHYRYFFQGMGMIALEPKTQALDVAFGTIQASTSRNESFNGFARRVAYGGGGVINTNDRLAKKSHQIQSPGRQLPHIAQRCQHDQ